MTQSQGEMREIYPEAGEAYRYRMEEGEGHFTLDLEDEVRAGIRPATILSIESRETEEGLCRSESGRTHFFAWAWVGPELHQWLKGSLFVFQWSETPRRGHVLPPKYPHMSWPPCSVRCWRCWPAKGTWWSGTRP